MLMRRLALLLTVAVGLAACADDVGLIDRTQANFWQKKDFAGVWYEMSVVTDMPSSAAFGFTGLLDFGGKEGKIVFDIQENFLVVYPYVEPVLGGDAKWSKRKIRKYWDDSVRNRADRKVRDSDFIELVVGNPTAMFPITHFDRKRAYDPATGTESNLLVENTTDRPWWQRDYIRVDWMGNQLVNFMFPQGSVNVSAVDYYVQGDGDVNSDDPNRFYMAPEGGYFHFTRRLFGQPMSTGACSPYSLAPGDCAGAQFDVRISFRRADPRHQQDVEILPYPNGGAQDRFGFFLADRYRWDEDYGLVYSGHDYKAARWNLWERSKDFSLPTNDKGEPVSKTCLTQRDCPEPQVCDQSAWFEPGVCKVGHRIDYSQRRIRPIIYHIGADTPVDHLPAEYDTADGWSDAFQETVSWLRFWEQKWAPDTVDASGKPMSHVGFTDPQSKFGQRFCKSHADCSGHALAQRTLDVAKDANRVVVATKTADGKPTALLVEDCLAAVDPASKKVVCTDRPPMPAGAAYVAFINASPGVASASLTGIGPGLAGVKPAVDVAKAKEHALVVPTAQHGTFELKADLGGGKTVGLPAVEVGANDVLLVVLVGGDRLVVARSKGQKTGLRLMHGLASSTTEAGVSEGVDVEGGVNGVRAQEPLHYARTSDFVAYSGDTAHVTFLRVGGRSDVACLQDNGVGVCTGWHQQLTPDDQQQRQQVKAGLQDIFVLCENQFTRTKAVCDAAGQTGKKDAHNDCRYWIKRDGKDWNPCADVQDGGLVPHAAEPKRHGDLRYPLMYWVTNTQPTSPLGYGPSVTDPDTGEIIYAAANIYGGAMLTYAQYGKDLVDLLNGDLSEQDIATGKYIKDYILSGGKAALDQSLWGALPPAIGAELPSPAVDALTPTGPNPEALLRQQPVALPTPDDLKGLHELDTPQGLAKWLEKSGALFDLSQVQARMDQVRGTPVERAMINGEVALVASEGAVQPGEELPPEMIGKLSPAEWASPKAAIDERKRQLLLGSNSIETQEFADPAILGLAKRMKCQDGQEPTTEWQGDKVGPLSCYKGDALRTALSVALFRAVVEHEVGHTVGLRHNFEASFDMMNYFDPYYDPALGREREPVACFDVPTAQGTLGKNDMCEQFSLGETCVIKKCKKDSDCPGQGEFKCGSGKCVNGNGGEVGTCHGSTPRQTPCVADDGSVNCGADLCRNGWCGQNVSCSAPADCDDGETCTGGKCVDAATAKPRVVAAFDTSVGELKKYVPRAAPTEKEVLNRRIEYQYSSVMDYGQKVNSGIWGLGKYDYAALKFGYGEMIEVYADTSFAREQTRRTSDVTKYSFESQSWRMDVYGNGKYGLATPNFTILNDWMPPEFNSKRETVPAHLPRLEEQNAEKFGRNAADRTYFQVPYRYHSDEYNGSLGIATYDTGATAEEIVYHAGQAVTEYYLWDAFKRERLWFGVGGSPLGYYSRLSSRWLNPLSAAGRFYALFNNIYRIYPFFVYVDRATFQLASLRRASLSAFEMLAAMVTAPAPGSYQYDKLSNSYVNVSYEPGQGEAGKDIPMGVGKFPWTTFATQSGYYYYNHPLWIGGYWDKVAAISALTNSNANFLLEAVGEQLPLFRGTAIGFNTIYPRELASLLGGFAAGDVAQMGGTFDKATGKYQTRDFFKPLDGTAKRVQPSVLNTGLRLQAAWQAITNLPAGFDPEFTDSMAIWLKGNGDAYTPGKAQVGSKGEPIGVEQVEFEDPFGGKTYVALKPNYDVDRYSPTYQMIRRLNELKTGCADGSVCSAQMDGSTACKGSGQPCAASYWQKASGADKDALAVQIKQEIEVLDMFRSLYHTYGSVTTN
jgi:hypothetical protein